MNNIIWGLIVLVSGVFIATYGSLLFRFALAFLGFALGMSMVMWLGDGLSEGLRIFVALAAGGILAMVFYFLVNFTLYIAGGLMGLVLMLAVLALFRLGGMDLGILNWVLVLAAAGAGGFFGPRLGQTVVVLASSLAGSYLVVLGLNALFANVGSDTGEPLALLSTSFPLVLFLTLVLMSFLGQYQAFTVRRRFLR